MQIRCMQHNRKLNYQRGVTFLAHPVRGGFRHVQHVRPTRGSYRRGPTGHRSDIFWSAKAFLQRVKILLGAVYATFSGLGLSIAKSEAYDVTRSCNAEFIIRFCTLMSENLCRAQHIFRTGPKWLLNLAVHPVRAVQRMLNAACSLQRVQGSARHDRNVHIRVRSSRRHAQVRFVSEACLQLVSVTHWHSAR